MYYYFQIGFLIGERKINVSNVITDESLNNTITEETICNYEY